MRRATLVLALTGALLACQSELPPAVTPDLGGAARRALDGAAAQDGTLAVRVPADGAVVPWTFARFDLQWDDGFRGSLFRVRVRAAGRVAWETVTPARRVRVEGADWKRVREAAGEGGAFEVEVVGASVMPDGQLLRGPVRASARARFSAAGEHPTGNLTFAWVGRLEGVNPGPGFNPKVMGDSRLMQVGMDGAVTPLMTRFTWKDAADPALRAPEPRFPGPDAEHLPLPAAPRGDGEPAPPSPFEAVASRSFDLAAIQRQGSVPAWSRARDTQSLCLACHALSRDGRYLATSTNEEVEAMPGYDLTAGQLLVIRRADGALLRVIGAGLFPRFNPANSDQMVYVRPTSTEGDGERTSLYWTDLHVMNVATGEDHAVHGADDPHQCELLPEWSPDGRALVFSRSEPYQPCEGNRGRAHLATVPWNDGAGGQADRLEVGTGGSGADIQGRYSPDGRWIVFHRTSGGFYARGTSSDLFAVPAAGGQARKLELNTDALESFHAFSPDGNWLEFQSNRDRVDQMRIYVARFFPDGTTSPAVPFPGPGDPDVLTNLADWTP